MFTVLLATLTTAFGAVTCQDGQSHASLSSALADVSCAAVHLVPGTYEGHFEVDRTVSITGDGAGATYIVSRGAPCLNLTAGATLSVTGVTLAGDQAIIAARDAKIRLTDVTITPLPGGRGGLLRLFDTDAIVSGVVFHMSNHEALAVDAVSGRGHDMTFDRVAFLGTLPAPEGIGAVYALNYGVSCTDCTFGGTAQTVDIPGIN